MLIAVDKKQQTVKAYEAIDQKQEFFCPNCKEIVFLKKGGKKIPHFAHYSSTRCQSFSEGETEEHLLAKKLVADWNYKKECCLEAYLPKLRQRPDILFENQLAIEIQCSPIKFQSFLQRTTNYLLHQYQPWWILGSRFFPRRRLSLFQKACCEYNNDLGVMLWIIDVDQQRLTCSCPDFWHYQYGYYFKQFHWNKNESWLDYPDRIRRKTPVTLKNWQPEGYRYFLTRKLIQKNREIILIQEKLYHVGGHLGQLPFWCYLPSRYHFFFEHYLLVLRYYFQLDPRQKFLDWLKLLQPLNWCWSYPLVSQKEILFAVYQECCQLSKNSYF